MSNFSGGQINKNGSSPEDSRRKENQMLSVAEKKPKATLLKAVGGDYVTVSPDMRAADWLEAQIAKSRNGVVSQIAEMTPALARVLLNRNDGNRKISDAIVTSYARDMVHGAWQFNGEPVIVSADGKLNDGQHRCEAVVRADVSIPALFVFGVERATRTTLDQGKIRTVGDFLSMGGHVNTNHLGAAANLAWQYLAHGQLSSGGSNRATKSEILSFVEVNPNIVTSVSFVQQKGADAVGGRPTLGFVHWALWQKAGRQKADGFINNLIDGADLNHRSPILYVRNRLINGRGRMRANDKAELIFKAWNAYRLNETPRHFETTGSLPKLER